MKKVYLFIFSSLMFLSVFCFTQATLAVCTQSITVNTAFDYYGTPACNPGTTTPGTISVAMSSAQVTSLLNNNKTLSLYNNIPNTAYTVNGKCFDYMTSISLETCVPRDPLNGSCSITAKSGTCAVPTCNNGYINYPTCNTCPVGKGMYNNSCVTCPAGTILSGSVCVDNCTQSSGATLDISKIKKYTLTNFPGNVSDIMLISHTTDYNSLFSVPFPSSPNPYVGPYNIPILINYSLKTYTGDNGMSYGFTLPSFDFPTVVSGYDINSGAFQYSVSLGGGLYSAPYIGSGNGDYHANEYYSGCLSLVASACPTKTSLSGLSCVGSPTLTLSNNKCGTILLTWTDVSPGVYYNIYKSDKSTFIASTTGMTYELSNLTAGTYDYVIEAVGKYGDRFWSDPKTIPIVNCFLNVATSTFCGLTGGSVGLSWNSILNTKYYTIYDYTGTTILATTTGLTYSKTGFPQDTFGYYVEALGNDGSKIKSGPVNVTVKGCVNISSSVIQDTPSLCKNTVNLS